MIKRFLKINRVTQYAEEQVAYGINYFMKVCIGDGLFIHIRVHQRPDEEAFDFYSLHEVIKHNQATCVFKEGKTIQLFITYRIYFNILF
jgi:hypothetical protein